GGGREPRDERRAGQVAVVVAGVLDDDDERRVRRREAEEFVPRRGGGRPREERRDGEGGETEHRESTWNKEDSPQRHKGHTKIHREDKFQFLFSLWSFVRPSCLCGESCLPTLTTSACSPGPRRRRAGGARMPSGRCR